jgi:CrcB protein
MIIGEFLAVCVAGGLGAALRYLVDSAVRCRLPTRFPLSTMIINITGSLALGLLIGLVLAHLVAHPWQLIVGVGFLGGYTTFSTASVETVRLLEERRWTASVVNALGMLVLGTAAAAAGYLIGVAVS